MKKYSSPSVELFKLNRSRFSAQMKPNSIAIFVANDMMPRSADLYHDFRQSPDLYYLTGIDQEETMLVIYPDCPKGEKFKEVLFIRQTNDLIKVWEGDKYTQEQAKEVSGIQQVKWTSEKKPLLNEMILLADHIYLNTNENDRAVPEVITADLRLIEELRSKYPLHHYERAQPIMKKLRMVKSQYEIDIIQKACNITRDAFLRVLKTTKPGMNEYEVEAEIIHEFIRQGATGHAYHPIIASGKNACVLHYNDNCETIKEGDVMLMDFGCEYGNYASDLTRCIPVGGKFSPRQKDVYNAVLRVMKYATSLLKPGLTLEEYNGKVGLEMQKELLGLGLITQEDINKQNPDWPAYKKYFMHGTSHHMGLDVHDLCNRYVKFEAGMVFTCEPGIYIPEEGIGIRLENDLVITNGEPIDLMSDIPLEADEIEALMG